MLPLSPSTICTSTSWAAVRWDGPRDELRDREGGKDFQGRRVLGFRGFRGFGV